MKIADAFEWVRRSGYKLATAIGLTVGLGFLYLYKIRSLVPGVNIYESETALKLVHFPAPWSAPIDWPFIAFARIIHKSGVDPILSLRLVSVGAGIVSVIMFYYLLKNWLFSGGKALVGAALFATSSWQLSVVRGGYGITFGTCFLVLFFILSTRVLYSTKPFIDWVLLVLIASIALYSPLIIWFVFVAAATYAVQSRGKVRGYGLKLYHYAIFGAIGIVLTVPLIVGILRDQSAFRALFFGGELDGGPIGILSNIGNTISALFFRSDNASVFGLGSLPLLDIFSVFMFLLGIYYFERRLLLRRSKIVLGGFVIGLVVVSLAGFSPIHVSILLPLVYLIVAAGVSEVISRWLAVFPKNPVARSIGIVFIALSIGFVSGYHLTRYFIARTGNPAIRSMYTTTEAQP